MSVVGGRVLLWAAGLVTFGMGAGFERTLDSAQKTARLPRPIPLASPAVAVTAPSLPVAISTAVPAVTVSDEPAPSETIHPTLERARPASATPAPEKPRSVHRAAAVPLPAGVTRTAAPEEPIAAATDDLPVYQVAPSAPPAHAPAVDAASLAAPRTPEPTPTPTPRATPTPKPKTWLRRTLDSITNTKKYTPQPATTPHS